MAKGWATARVLQTSPPVASWLDALLGPAVYCDVRTQGDQDSPDLSWLGTLMAASPLTVGAVASWQQHYGRADEHLHLERIGECLQYLLDDWLEQYQFKRTVA
jgi:hypothetical protein